MIPRNNSVLREIFIGFKKKKIDAHISSPNKNISPEKIIIKIVVIEIMKNIEQRTNARK